MLQPNAFGAACSRIAFDAANCCVRSLAIAAPLSASSLSSLICSLDGGFHLRWRFSSLSISFVCFPFHCFVVFDCRCRQLRIFFSDFLKQPLGSFVHTPHGFCAGVPIFDSFLNSFQFLTQPVLVRHPLFVAGSTWQCLQ